ncbi:RepA [Pteropus associated gemycircularvirus 4]|uniref:RepA n=1 Tax=Pteropus associated gemycircularvirus 4 TaxID=1985398 RepID=A0A140CTS5_9VIRU|nr:RepA [Pteropus associated gemycircularvirus 4]AMH87732.1 RepA [Pteropus associated gemycircularvirus 4]
MPSNGLFVNSRYKLLTYAQCGDLDPFDIVDLLSGLQGECIVGRELHSDGGIHLHVFVDFGRKFRSRSVGIFDVGGRHPNVVASWGTPEEGYDYAIKDGDVVAGGLERPTPRESRAGNGSAAAKWATIADADDREQFFELVKSLDPKTFVTRLQDLQRFADWKFRSDPEPYITPNNIHFPDDGTDGRAEWVRDNLVLDWENHS